MLASAALVRLSSSFGGTNALGMKISWSKREWMLHGPEFPAILDKLYKSIEARYAPDLAKAGFFRRIILRYRIAREFNEERTKEVEL